MKKCFKSKKSKSIKIIPFNLYIFNLLWLESVNSLFKEFIRRNTKIIEGFFSLILIKEMLAGIEIF